ncbi:hypothetical protein EXM56_13020 [Clostridium botulinum]|uniref:Uncharacterized protein n=2 Tax=Clostridium botulinum TaxID=1491 RepID=A0A6G4CRW0_CLOBO|nr:hypothetical protein [Clostridium botulinum]NFA00855.1 hypothetical protein [Clostridium botulinum]NFA32515.1 hypothetical protein [Clostridium botulinum]NFA86024.1 hypothetical protein [Clostridium botulinum]NFB07299.1 hypothetical protein [Clostridium botulinum]
MGKITMKEYQQKMEKKHKGALELINSKLLQVDSFSRGKMLYDLLNTININDLKYYIFCNWWDSIDSYHSYFDEFKIKEWLECANVDLEIDKLPISDGYMKIYRGTHEYNQSWDGLSWTTDIKVAKKFANGCGVRFQTKHPKLLTGIVQREDIIGIFNERNEKEILCLIVEEGSEEELEKEHGQVNKEEIPF